MKKTYERPALVAVGALSKHTASEPQFSGDPPSDRRLKTNISRIGTTVFGLPFYRFSYLGSDAAFTGVMAQDVLGVMPQAVSRDATGFYSVDYGMLGVAMGNAA